MRFYISSRRGLMNSQEATMRQRFVAQSMTLTISGRLTSCARSCRASDYQSRTAAALCSRSRRERPHLAVHHSASLTAMPFVNILWQRFGMTCHSMVSGQTSQRHSESSREGTVQQSYCRKFMSFDEAMTGANHALQPDKSRVGNQMAVQDVVRLCRRSASG